MYKRNVFGNTMIREVIRQHHSTLIQQQKSTYLILIKKTSFHRHRNFYALSKFDSFPCFLYLLPFTSTTSPI